MSITFEIRAKSRYVFGFIYEFKKPAYEYLNAERTRIGVIPPQKLKEGQNISVWGYQKLLRKDEI